MDRLWWQLPGPSRYLDRVERDVCGGCNVLLPLPRGAVADLAEAVADRVHRHALLSWRTLRLSDADAAAPPARLLQEHFAPPDGPAPPADARRLARSPDFAGLVVWVEGMTAAAWPAWQKFLLEYEGACRLPGEHGLLCVPLVGDAAAAEPAGELRLTVRPWRGQVDRLDMALFLAHLLHETRLPALHRRLAVAVGVELAGTDQELARALAAEGTRWFVEPRPALERAARARGWEAATPLEWRDGLCDDFEGAAYVHSAALAARGDWPEAARRVWLGQVGVLFGFLEQQRARLIEELRPWLKPMTSSYGQRREVRDLEFGHLHFQVNGTRAPREARLRVERLKDMRDALAHLEPVGEAALFSPEVLALCGG
jgi:hypothetical protein